MRVVAHHSRVHGRSEKKKDAHVILSQCQTPWKLTGVGRKDLVLIVFAATKCAKARTLSSKQAMLEFFSWEDVFPTFDKVWKVEKGSSELGS